MLTIGAMSCIIPIAHLRNGGIAQLARACGSYPQCPRFESRCRYQTRRRYKPAPLLWPVGQAVKTPPFHGGNMGSIPVRVTTSSQAIQSLRRFFMLSSKKHFVLTPLLIISDLDTLCWAPGWFWACPQNRMSIPEFFMCRHEEFFYPECSS